MSAHDHVLEKAQAAHLEAIKGEDRDELRQEHVTALIDDALATAHPNPYQSDAVEFLLGHQDIGDANRAKLVASGLKLLNEPDPNNVLRQIALGDYCVPLAGARLEDLAFIRWLGLTAEAVTSWASCALCDDAVEPTQLTAALVAIDFTPDALHLYQRRQILQNLRSIQARALVLDHLPASCLADVPHDEELRAAVHETIEWVIDEDLELHLDSLGLANATTAVLAMVDGADATLREIIAAAIHALS